MGKTLGRYKIIEEIGSGGMGVVYRARDERLDRDVALKVLNPGALTGEEARMRFRREALALARLNHPNIGSIFDFDSEDGTDFLVMEFVSGPTLAARLASGPLSEKQAATIGMQIAAALEEAHEQGLIHRDLKPGNVMLTAKGTAKVLDFGLAKLLAPSGDDEATRDLTQTRGTVGTLPYMAPEQLRGEAVDPRADIYSLGLILYELVTGHRAYPENQAALLVDSILRQAPVAPRAIEGRISAEFERIILKCIEKNPDDRYQSALELEVDLRRLISPSSSAVSAAVVPRRRSRKKLWWAVGGATGLVALLAIVLSLTERNWRTLLPAASRPRINSLAVLPLQNLSGDPKQEYFAEGMTDELITTLSQIHGLKVIARSSVMRYRGSDEPVSQIAERLHVAAVVEGSVLSANGQVRITAQLIQPSTDQNLWAQSYDGSLKNVIALQNNVARDIANQIRVRLRPQVKKRLAGGQPVDPQAFEAYLKGRFYWNQRDATSVKTGLGYFQQAVKDDPKYALGYVGLADSYLVLAGDQWIEPATALPKAAEAAHKALALDPDLAEAYTALANVDQLEWHWNQADRNYRRALALNPGYAVARQWYAYFLGEMGRTREALAEARRAATLDPLSPVIEANVGQLLYYSHRYKEAEAVVRKAIPFNPNFFPFYYISGTSLVMEKDYARGITDLKQAERLSSGDATVLAALCYAYAKAGQKNKAERVFAGLEQASRSSFVSPYSMAIAETGLGENKAAIRSLELGIARHDSQMPWLRSEPMFGSLRSDPRFQALVNRIGYPDSIAALSR
jgi:serine/threonine-protein kinase